MTEEPEPQVYEVSPEVEFADAVTAAIEALFDASAVHQDDKTKLIDALKKSADSLADKHLQPEEEPENPKKPDAVELEDKPRSSTAAKGEELKGKASTSKDKD